MDVPTSEPENGALVLYGGPISGTAGVDERLPRNPTSIRARLEALATAWEWPLTLLKIDLIDNGASVTAPVLQLIEEQLAGMRLIFIVGETGCGKSSLLEELTGYRQDVSNTLEAGRQKCGIWPVLIQGRPYLFVDTPGFGSAGVDDTVIMGNIVSGLRDLGPRTQMAGVLFLHAANKDRLHASDIKMIRWLQCFCGPAFYQNVTIVTSKWDKVTSDDLRDANSKIWEAIFGGLNAVRDPPCPFMGAGLYHHGFQDCGSWIYSDDQQMRTLSRKRDQAERCARIRALIHERYGRPRRPVVKLQIQAELDEGRA
ncbi:hypothetical protein O9K51_08341 [Purpureocillium lavendulum]|uniref:G domain-containing protein n=1 Tax=Purpureocillium lavendulum TaxID=1247861 RepID=A0AB34FHR3_9HYPO|nr:hypothetical protein O9K51_08341 [Purpureocillium lavendulum]